MNSRMLRIGLGGIAAVAAVVTTSTAAFAGQPGPHDAHPNIGSACAVGNLCVFDGPNFTGTRHDYFRCGTYDVRSDGLTRVGSFLNNQTGDQVASFFGPDPNGAVVFQYSSTAVDARSDATDRTTWVVKPC